jgi:FMNH2-dependent dimethyl sulfone monooxygenase|nr:LLM class flavin-dependent oxidoreductase [Gulosibacter faecalis]
MDRWLRNVDETFPIDLAAQQRIAREAERVGFDITLILELNLSDIGGADGPVLDAWTLAAALGASTERLEILAAIRPIYHQPVQLAAKQAATQHVLTNGRFSVNVVSGWWAEEARQYGVEFAAHDDRYAFTREYVEALKTLWRDDVASFDGEFVQFENVHLQPKPQPAPHIFAGGESPAGRASITEYADSYLTHGGTVEELAEKIADMRGRREAAGLEPFTHFGMAAFAIVRDTEEEALTERDRITNVAEGSPGFQSYQDFISKSELNVNVSLEDYSVSNRGLRPNFVGTPEQVARRILEFERVGLDVLLLQFADPEGDLVRFGEQVIPLVEELRAAEQVPA